MRMIQSKIICVSSVEHGFMPELLKQSKEKLQTSHDVRSSSVADIQTGLNALITDLLDMDCTQFDQLLFKSLESLPASPSLCLPLANDCITTSAFLLPEQYIIKHDSPTSCGNNIFPFTSEKCNLNDFAESYLLNQTDKCLEDESASEFSCLEWSITEDLQEPSRCSSLAGSRGSLVRRTWIEGEMMKEEEKVVDDHTEEEGNFKVTQRVRMIRHVIPVTEIVEFMEGGSVQLSEMISRRRVVEVNVEEEVDVCPKSLMCPGEATDSLKICEENVKEHKLQGRHKISVHSRSNSFSEDLSDDISTFSSNSSAHIRTDVEVTAEILPGNSLRTRRIVRTQSTPSPSFE